jgi:hypothetical protein
LFFKNTPLTKTNLENVIENLNGKILSKIYKSPPQSMVSTVTETSQLHTSCSLPPEGKIPHKVAHSSQAALQITATPFKDQ